MCRECEGLGVELGGARCAECRGTGRRPGLNPLFASVRETVHGFVEPLLFACFMVREYGWRLGRPLDAARLVWRDQRGNRRALLRHALAVVR